MTNTIRSRGGRALDELAMEGVRDGTLSIDDFAVSREQLEAQARAADAHGYRQLADNLRRAAEMTALSNERVMQIYEMLRPGRASGDALAALAGELAARDMPRLAAFVAEAADAYRARGIG